MLALPCIHTELIVPDLKRPIDNKKVNKAKKSREAKKNKPKRKSSSSTTPDSAKAANSSDADATGETERIKSDSNPRVTHSGRYRRQALSKNMKTYSDNDLAAVLCTPITTTTTTLSSLPSSGGDVKNESKREKSKAEAVTLKKQVYITGWLISFYPALFPP